MSKATEEALSELHGSVARACTLAVTPVTGEAGVLIAPSAAHIMAAVSFLKNNNITADARSNGDLAALNEALAAKRKKRKLSLLDISDAADHLERDLGDFYQ